MVSKVIDIGLRALQFFCTIVVMALVGNMIAESIAGNPSIINYDMFVAVFSLLSLVLLFATAFTGALSGTPIPLGLDLLNTLFFFAGAVAMSAKLGVHSCNDEDYVRDNSITNGSRDQSKRCRESQASTAFMWFAFIAYTVSCVFSALSAKSGGVNLRAPGIRKGGPVMSQA